jgi:lipoate-protein ligase A
MRSGLLLVAARYERVPDAYCSGRYDIAVGCRKLAGTAGFVRRLGDVWGSVVHASIRLDEHEDELKAVTNFERAIGLKPNYRSDRITSLRREIEQDE